MKKRNDLSIRTGILLILSLLCLCLDVQAAPSIDGNTDLKAAVDEIVTAEYTITNDKDMESVSLTLSYDKNILTYMSGSGGNNFSGNGGNGSVQLSSKPGGKTASFAVKFKGKADGDTKVELLSCTATVDGKEINMLGESEGASEGTEGTAYGTEESASWVIDGRAFYLQRPGNVDGFDVTKIDIQGIQSRVLKHMTLEELYIILLYSDNGSFRDYFVYNPDTGNVIPFVQMQSGTDTVIFIEPDEKAYVPTRYIAVDLGWGPKYTLPAYKHVIVDGIDEFPDDTNRYLLYGINQEGEKAWYSFDYDKNSVQLFDDVAYQGEQNYILSLEESAAGQKSEAAHLLNRYNADMGRRLTIIMIMTILLIVQLNLIVFLCLRMRKMRTSESEEEKEEPEESGQRPLNAYVTGNLEENETDFQEPLPEDGTEEGTEIELEIIDLDELEDED